MNTNDSLYDLFCILMPCYLFFLSGGMIYKNPLTKYALENDTAYSQKTMRKICITVGINYMLWALSFLVYIPEEMLSVEQMDAHTYYIYFLVNVILCYSGALLMVNCMLQVDAKMMLLRLIPVVPVVILLLVYLFVNTRTVLLIMIPITAVQTVLTTLYYNKLYNRYRALLLMEYSNLTHRDLRWIRITWVLLNIQLYSYMISEITYVSELMFLNIGIIIFQSIYIARCVKRMQPLSWELIEENKKNAMEWHKNEENAMPAPTEKEMSERNKIISSKLKKHCEEQKMFLKPELTREVLCQHIGINRTYLAEYLKSNGTTYYQYINSLRIAYACKLMRQDPNSSIAEISNNSGYNNQSTFRKAFREIMGCLPSEYNPEEENRM